nr:MAG TPA: hypothetical protein [Caudoviricetes sp.]
MQGSKQTDAGCTVVDFPKRASKILALNSESMVTTSSPEPTVP